MNSDENSQQWSILTKVNKLFLQIKFNSISFSLDKISEELSLLSKQIRKAREQDDFFETDLHSWISTLDQLKQQLIHVPSIKTIKEDLSTPLIYKLQLNNISMQTKSKDFNDVFHDCLNGAIIEDNGRLIVHKSSIAPVEIRGRNEYSFGVHEFRFQIENNPLKTWIFFGIQASITQMTKQSYQTHSAYGWADFNDFFIAGVRQNGQLNAKFSHTKEGDIIVLVLNCGNRTICYTNEQNQCQQNLEVDLNKCPFP